MRILFCFSLAILLSPFYVKVSNIMHHRTGGDGGFMKGRPGRLDEPDLSHAALMLHYKG